MAGVSVAWHYTYCGLFRPCADAGKSGGDFAGAVSDYGGTVDKRGGVCLCTAGEVCQYGKKYPEKCGDPGVREAALYGVDHCFYPCARNSNVFDGADHCDRFFALAVHRRSTGGVA